MAALLRAYRIGSTRFRTGACRNSDGGATTRRSSARPALLRIAGILAASIDPVSEEVVSAYEAEKENWLRNQSVARAARVRPLLRNEQVDMEFLRGHPGLPAERQYHLGAVTWTTDSPAGGDALGLLERATLAMAADAHCDGRPIFIPQDEFCAWAWLPLSGRHDVAVPAIGTNVGDSIRFAFGEPASSGCRVSAAPMGRRWAPRPALRWRRDHRASS